MSDVFAVLIWWLLLQAMGLVALPLAFRLLRWLPDRGYSVAKPAGLLMGNYVLWLLGTLGWLRNSEGGIILAFAIVAACGLWVYWRWDDGPRLVAWLREHRWQIIAYEAVLLAAFVFWAVFRAHNPDLFTTEKPMEFAFMNAIRRSQTFPPPDPWLSDFGISYYYFGYVMMSTLTKLSGVAPGVAFSLTNAMWFALTAAGAFGIVANLAAASREMTRRAVIATGLLGALFVAIMGNLQGPLEVAHANGIGSAEFWRWLDIQEINTAPQPVAPGAVRWPFCDACSHPRGVWWFWRASRVLHNYPIGSDRGNPADYTEMIDEFPFFSFFLGDNHPHVLALPYALMSLALAFNLFRMAPIAASSSDSSSGSGSGWRQWFWKTAPIGVMYPLFLGGLSFLNTWDFPIHVLIAVLAWSLGRWMAGQLRIARLAADGFWMLVACGLLGILAYLPFYVGFRSQAAGILPNIFWPTPLPQFLVMFGTFLVIAAVFIAAALSRLVRERRLSAARAAAGSLSYGAGLVVGTAIVATAATLLVVAVSAGARSKLDEWTGDAGASGLSLTQAVVERLGAFGVPLLLGVMMSAVWMILRSERRATADSPDAESAAPFTTLLFGVGALLTFAVEYVYILDFFGTRMNTVFKLYYQAWALWGVASANAVCHLWRSADRLTRPMARFGFAAATIVMVGGGLVYPLLALPSGTRLGWQGVASLDATTPTREASADEAAAADWLSRNASAQAVVLEAVGASYRADTSRLSAWTGVPTVVGWDYHEFQWRGTYDDISPRAPDVDQIYQSIDPLVAVNLMKKYGVTYVYVGESETSKYPPQSLAKFGQFMDVVFQQGGSTIYRLRGMPAGELAGSN